MYCNPGDIATGGGGWGDSGAFPGYSKIEESEPITNGQGVQGWHVQTDTFAVVYPYTDATVVCLHLSSAPASAPARAGADAHSSGPAAGVEPRRIALAEFLSRLK